MNDNLPESGVRLEAGKSVGRELPPAAQRALEEAEARRAEAKPTPPRELNGRDGPDPVRYGDWEVKGLAAISRRARRGFSNATIIYQRLPAHRSEFRHESDEGGGGGRVSEAWDGQERSKSPRTCRDVRFVTAHRASMR